jgi:SAM-dependent methyltransferase
MSNPNTELDERIRREYDRVREFCNRGGTDFPEVLQSQSADYQGGLWRPYRSMLQMVPMRFEGRTVVDFGCKLGYLIPLLVSLGCEEAVGVDAEDFYVNAGNLVFPVLYPKTRLVKSEDGYVPLQPASADLIFMNEVISHINPRFLDTVWLECSRILRRGGILFISDGNNAANATVQSLLPELYEKWENGPDGVRTDRDVVEDNFRGRRQKIIRQKYPDMALEKVEFLANNTSGLGGAFLFETIDKFYRDDQLILRPYRKGVCPVNPEGGLTVMERAFHPVYLELALQEYGFLANQVRPAPGQEPQYFTRAGIVGRLTDMYVYARTKLAGWSQRFSSVDPEAYRYDNPGFQILAVKQ